MTFLFPFFLKCFLKLLFFPLPLFFNASTGSGGFLSRSASFFLSAADARSRFPTKSGFREIISGCSLLRSALTSASCLCLEFSYGLTSSESKLGSPAPGTMILEKPRSCEMPRTLFVVSMSALSFWLGLRAVRQPRLDGTPGVEAPVAMSYDSKHCLHWRRRNNVLFKGTPFYAFNTSPFPSPAHVRCLHFLLVIPMLVEKSLVIYRKLTVPIQILGEKGSPYLPDRSLTSPSYANEVTITD